MKRLKSIRAAEVVLDCVILEPMLDFFTERLGFRIELIYPADDPRVAVLTGYGLRIRLRTAARALPGHLRLLCDDPAVIAAGEHLLTAPNGTRIEWVAAETPLLLPPLKTSLVLNTRTNGGEWQRGRAGMLYRDLIPDRQGGRFIASHIRIPEGGPVPDYVHFHDIRFQCIYCYKGWVELVYEDQGPPFIMAAGDCVLQPPQIRHRVLSCSPGLEVIEIGCPAEHPTHADHDLRLPTARHRPERDFAGQRFVLHRAEKTPWTPWRLAGFEARRAGISAATDGLAELRVIRPRGPLPGRMSRHGGEFVFLFVLIGEGLFHFQGGQEARLSAGDCCVIPADLDHGIASASEDFHLLEVSLPA